MPRPVSELLTYQGRDPFMQKSLHMPQKKGNQTIFSKQRHTIQQTHSDFKNIQNPFEPTKTLSQKSVYTKNSLQKPSSLKQKMAYYVFNRIYDSIKKRDDLEIANKKGKKLLPEDLQSVLSKFKVKHSKNDSTDIQTLIS